MKKEEVKRMKESSSVILHQLSLKSVFHPEKKRMIRCLLFLLLLTLATDAQVLSLSQMYGSIKSPNFPEPYPNETELRWNVSIPEGFRVKLYFTHFDLEPSYLCEYDFVKVEAEREELALFCGKEESDTEAVPAQQVITSPRNSLSLLFSSDFSNEQRHSGFMAHYSAEDVDECSDSSDEDLFCDHFCHNFIGGYYCSCRYGYLLHTDNRTCRVECSDAVFRERSGILSSVDFPAPYPKSSDCLYRIEVEPGFKIRLQFDPSFNVEDHPDVRCPYDYIKITGGSTEQGPFCGDKSPGVIEVDSNVASVVFHSDNSGENLGWRLTYTAIGSKCVVPEIQPHALMNPVQSEYSFKDHIVFTCEPGFRLLKDGQYLDHFQIDCGSNGSWTSRPPQCHMVDCGSPKVVDLAEVVFGNHDNTTRFGSSVTYVCRGDMMEPSTSNTSYTCGQNGEWTNVEAGVKLPRCLPACGRPSRTFPPQMKRIVGGRTAEPGLFPWQVLLSVEDQSRVPEDHWFGSGALLSEFWVLTAAHVLRSQRRDASVVPVAPEHVKVFLGLHDANNKHKADSRSVDKVVLHPHFQPNNYNNDIALIRLTEAVEFNSYIRPVCLPSPNDEPNSSSLLPNSLGVVAGWGISNPNSTFSSSSPPTSVTTANFDPGLTSDILQYVKLPVVSQGECRASYSSRSVSYNITDNMFCAGFFEGGRDTCLGDSGGAFVTEDQLTRRWVVSGLVSWGGPEECGSRRVYGVYTRVASYVEWIEKHLQIFP
ncbi:mannan-binding lectin serine protease 1 isoform X1 [Cynoglossus semilaevis]|uniref:mannan-binding lectin serine protease 1 isoform X1 n=1 Tax=Cynoglossus semilaevis TaxID=244447 RepID=UPI0004985A5C|nr:mannan-binding lectin serine protease 1 isoform X1 [Cynoglossus semilaevis]